MADKPEDPKGGDDFQHNGKTYVVCAKGKCEVVHRDDQVWCIDKSCHPAKPDPRDPGRDCACVLLTAGKKDDEPKWGDPKDKPKNGKYPYDPDKYWYVCVCAHAVPGQ
jgi:hypothetical protein